MLGPRATGNRTAFSQAVRDYVEQSSDDPLVHRKVVQVVNGLADYLKEQRDRTPNEIFEEADRLVSRSVPGSARLSAPVKILSANWRRVQA